VVARDGIILGEGSTEAPGGPHAELAALVAAGAEATGATLYSTLEPCSHQGRTPPCVDAIIAAGVHRVVVGVVDPDEHVRGRGIAALRAAGLEVELSETATPGGGPLHGLAPYLHHRATGRAWCVAKTAMSLDGATAAADGSSRWITGSAARADGHELRADSQAIVIGSGTALADRPRLDVRGVQELPRTPPLRVLLDARGRVPAAGPLFDDALGSTLVVTTDQAEPHVTDAWRAAGAKVETVSPGPGGGVHLGEVLTLLGRHQVIQAMFEGGSTVHGALLAAGLIDHLVAYVAPVVLGTGARPVFAWAGPDSLVDAHAFALVGARALGDDVRLDYQRSR
jgi:diaminohydroxyphosphoribosylaminopyrimidine deaminase/5-amino-6-(5-phosphoribosylamino)uracil reductase